MLNAPLSGPSVGAFHPLVIGEHQAPRRPERAVPLKLEGYPWTIRHRGVTVHRAASL